MRGSSARKIAAPGNADARHAYGRILICLALVALLLGTDARTWADESAHDPALIRHLAQSLAQSSSQGDAFDAQVWLFSAGDLLTHFVDDRKLRMQILRSVYQQAHRQHVDPALVLAVIEVESGFDPYAVSRVGAQGLMQVMPFWKRELGRSEDNLIKVDTNIRYGTAILSYYLQGADGDLVRALSSYNGSNGALDYPERVLMALRRRWQMELTEKQPDLRESCRTYALVACR